MITKIWKYSKIKGRVLEMMFIIKYLVNSYFMNSEKCKILAGQAMHKRCDR